LCEFGEDTVLIDGAHTGDHRDTDGHTAVQHQVASILKTELPAHVSLLIVSHAHEDHIGCLPTLVHDGHLTAEFALVSDPDLAWGRATDGAPDEERDPRALVIRAAMHEEPRAVETPDAQLETFLQDALTLEGRYRRMLDELEAAGTTVIRYGRRAGYKKLRDRFAHLQLEVLGPSQDQLVITAELIRGRANDAVDQFSAMSTDASLPNLYRQIVQSTDALDAGRPGAAINLQSIVTRFTVGGKRFLFAGDMQFAKPGFSDANLKKSMRALRDKIAAGAPYAFAKLSHHGSDNAFSEEILEELGNPGHLGICAGSGSTAHPHPDTLNILDKRRKNLKWVRTDHNGLSTLSFGAKTTISVAEGTFNDARPNSRDTSVVEQPKTSGPFTPVSGTPESFVTAEATVAPEQTTGGGGRGDRVEVFARVPHVRTKVTLTIDVDPHDGGGTVSAPQDRSNRTAAQPRNWRPSSAVNGLLFVTSRDALARNIGAQEAQTVTAGLQAAGATLLELQSTANVVRTVAQQVARSRPRGVVLLGGFDVVPSQRVDVLPAALRTRLGATEDPDDFIVWSDDIFGDTDGDALAEIPVSRIPDGHSAAVVFGTLAASTQPQPTRVCVHNDARPFARTVFERVPGNGKLFKSHPAIYSDPQYTLDGHHVYLMLHGDYTDSSRFWGEGTTNNAEAVNITNIPQTAPSVVFTGCCWGGLTVDKPAGRWRQGQPIGVKSADTSIALTFLARGARAFVGCTGAHYSPTAPPYNFFGGPMHAAFWSGYAAGKAPAQALFDAKIEYLKAMPHGQRTDIGQAIEFKILRQYTCLGLGW
jgi:beta-lactamase superfamily II metal-dependent hydrolase